MKKKILVFLTTLALLVSMTMPAFALEFSYGISDEAGETVTEQQIYQLVKSINDNYGIEAYYIESDEYSGDGSAKDYFDITVFTLTTSDDFIIYARTVDDDYVCASGKAADAFSDTDLDNLVYDVYNCKTVEESALEFFSKVNGLLAVNAMSSGQQDTDSYEVPDSEMEGQPVDEYNRVVDTAKLLTADEVTSLTQKINEISERQQFDIVIVTVNTLEGKTPQEYADDYYDYNGYGFGENNDGCLLLISLEESDWYISTTGYGITAFTDAGIEYIGKQLVDDMGDGKWSKAFTKFADLADDFVTQAKSGTPYDTGNLPKNVASIIKSILVSLAIGLIAAFILTDKISKKYTKAVHKKADAGDYLVNGSLQLTGSYENFSHTNVSRTPIQNESSSGSSTHTSSSGTTHGGGGGKF